MKCIRILHLEDSAADAKLVECYLEGACDWLPTSITRVARKSDFLSALGSCQFDVILSDHRMPDLDGDEALSIVKEKTPYTPFIMVTGELGEERAIETLKRGATDYVLKDNMLRLGAAIERALAEAESDRRRREAEQSLREITAELDRRVQTRTAGLLKAYHEMEAYSYSVSHDLKAPLRSIRGFTRLLIEGDQSNLTEKQKEYLKTVQESARQMDELIDALLEFSRLGRKPLQLVPVEMRRLVQSVVDDERKVHGERGVRARVTIGDLPEVKADPVLIRQAVTNLLSNAFKFTRKVEIPCIAIGSHTSKGMHFFFVRDNGVGFPKAHTERLFRVFQRLHPLSEFEGTGIGLANVKKIIELHGGLVCAESEEGNGATFYFSLPTKEAGDDISELLTARSQASLDIQEVRNSAQGAANSTEGISQFKESLTTPRL